MIGSLGGDFSSIRCTKSLIISKGPIKALTGKKWWTCLSRLYVFSDRKHEMVREYQAYQAYMIQDERGGSVFIGDSWILSPYRYQLILTMVLGGTTGDN